VLNAKIIIILTKKMSVIYSRKIVSKLMKMENALYVKIIINPKKMETVQLLLEILLITVLTMSTLIKRETGIPSGFTDAKRSAHPARRVTIWRNPKNANSYRLIARKPIQKDNAQTVLKDMNLIKTEYVAPQVYPYLCQVIAKK